MIREIGLLLHDLVFDRQNGTPVLVEVHDYRERAELVAALQEEAEVYDISITVFTEPSAATEGAPRLNAGRNEAAILLIDAEQAQPWARFLEPNREQLPAWCRFVIVMVMSSDVPMLAREAPAFWSWVKNRVIEKLLPTQDELPQSDIDQEVARMHEATGLTPEAYIRAWEQGNLPDTYEHSAWLNLAYAVLGRAAK